MIVGISKNNSLERIDRLQGTKFTRLKYSDPVGTGGGGRGPLVELGSPENFVEKVYNDMYTVKARIDDKDRITAMLVTPNGLRWEGHTAILNNIQNKHDIEHIKKYGGDSSIKELGKIFTTGAKLTASVLGQTAVAGTGLYFTPFANRAYTEPVGNGIEFKPQMHSGNLFIAGDSKFKGEDQLARPRATMPSILEMHSAEETSGTPYEGKDIGKKTVSIESGNPYSRKSSYTAESGSRLQKAVEDSTKTVDMRTEQGAYYNYPNPLNPEAHESRKLIELKQYSKDKKYDYTHASVSKDVRDGFILYGIDKHRKTIDGPLSADTLLSSPAENSDQARQSGLIPFYISSVTPTKRVNCVFEANLDSYSDEYTGTWEDIQYIGRADKFHIYSGFDRKISFTFKVVAKMQENLVPIYDKLNYLAGTTAPTYDANGTFMRGTLACVRIGDVLKDQVGIFTQISFKWDINVPWELNSGDGCMVVPHMLTVNASFTPIHSFIPTADSIYIGDSKQFSARQ